MEKHDLEERFFGQELVRFKLVKKYGIDHISRRFVFSGTKETYLKIT